MKIFQRRPESESTSKKAGDSKKIDDRLQEVFVYDEGDLPQVSAASQRPQLAASKAQASAGKTLEAGPTGNYVQNLRKNGGDRTYSPQSPAQNSQGSSAMAGDNSKFITVPYSLMPAQGEGQGQGAESLPNRQQIEEAVMTAVQQHVRTDSANSENIKQERDRVQSVVLAIRKAKNSEDVMKAAVAQTREVLGADRVLLYKCDTETKGQVQAEALTTGWTPTLGETLPLCLFGGEALADYNNGQVFAFNREQPVDFTPYQNQLMEQYQVQASLALPMMLNDQVWGILVAHQCNQPRQWRETEIDLMYHVVTELRLKLQATEFRAEADLRAIKLEEATERERIASKIIDRVRRSFTTEQVFKTTTQEIRRFLDCDRAVVYKFNDDWSGTFIAESAGSRLNSILGQGFSADMGNCHSLTSLRPEGIPMDSRDVKIADISIKQGRDYNRSGFYLSDIEAFDLPDDFMVAMEGIGTRAYLMTGIFLGEKLWGMLAVYHGEPRVWQDADRQLVSQIATQCGVALQQAFASEELERRTLMLEDSAKREKLASSIINRISQSLNTEEVFKITTQEMRSFMGCDRAVIYQFHEDWSGTFVAESVGSRLNSILGKGFSADMGNCHSLTSLRPEGMPQDSRDVKIAAVSIEKGRDYTRSGFFLDDILAHDLPRDFLEAMEGIGARAYLMTGIFVGDKLWGMLSLYHGDVRTWADADRNLVSQIATQCGIALKQSQFVAEIQKKSNELGAVVAREKAAKEEFQREVVELLRAVAPALRGDLTVRAPVTEDEVGTVADAYNNTIHALRSIVVQVKEAATQVSSTSKTSGEAIAQLSSKAQKEVHVVEQALNEIQSMQDATEEVVTTAQGVEAAVQQANQVVKRGDNAMDRTVDGIMAIRSTVSETSKKIKRLSESSQKISRVVSLIGDFTTQTQLLALNAAIEATRAGEYGRGFAVVADEVRSLARQSAEATTEIEKLVQEIQAETGAVTQAMDTGIDQVVTGTNLVNETRDSLTEIVEATAQISSFVEGITQSANSQSKQFKSVAKTMNGVTELASETSKESLDISDSFKELLTTAEDLQATVGKFKV